MVDLNFEMKLLEMVKRELAEEHELDDDKAEDIIIRLFYDDPRSNSYTLGETKKTIENIFLKTRSELGILSPLIEDPDINEIMVNGKDSIFYEKNGRIGRYELSFDSTEELEEVMRNIAGGVHREFNEMNPIVDARLGDGSRVSCVYKNVAVNGPILTVRKFSESYIRMADLVENGTLSDDEADFLRALVRSGYNIFISGGTSSGKTTMLNALSEAIPEDERVIVIEDSAELKLGMIENIVHLECRNANSAGKGRVSMTDLIKSSLRMRPDRIIVGEVRGGEVVEMLSAMNTGHTGSMSTGHGNSVSGMLKRLESMYLMAVSLDVEAIRSQIAEGIDVMIHIERSHDGKRRIREIVELLDYREGEFIVNDLMSMDSPGLRKLGKARVAGEEFVEILSSRHIGRGCDRKTLF